VFAELKKLDKYKAVGFFIVILVLFGVWAIVRNWLFFDELDDPIFSQDNIKVGLLFVIVVAIAATIQIIRERRTDDDSQE